MGSGSGNVKLNRVTRLITTHSAAHSSCWPLVTLPLQQLLHSHGCRSAAALVALISLYACSRLASPAEADGNDDVNVETVLSRHSGPCPPLRLCIIISSFLRISHHRPRVELRLLCLGAALSMLDQKQRPAAQPALIAHLPSHLLGPDN